ncbi:MAG: hypothetical protein ACHQ6V_03130 [Myxococcota bacterium]
MSVGGWIQGRFLRSRVARRIFFVVVASALLPISLFAAITWFSTSAQLESDAHARLAREAKQLGMRAIERLLLIDTALAAPNVAAGDVFLSGKLRRLSVAPGAALALAPVELARLSDGAALLRLSSGAPPRVELIRQRQDESFLSSPTSIPPSSSRRRRCAPTPRSGSRAAPAYCSSSGSRAVGRASPRAGRSSCAPRSAPTPGA